MEAEHSKAKQRTASERTAKQGEHCKQHQKKLSVFFITCWGATPAAECSLVAPSDVEYAKTKKRPAAAKAKCTAMSGAKRPASTPVGEVEDLRPVRCRLSVKSKLVDGMTGGEELGGQISDEFAEDDGLANFDARAFVADLSFEGKARATMRKTVRSRIWNRIKNDTLARELQASQVYNQLYKKACRRATAFAKKVVAAFDEAY